MHRTPMMNQIMRGVILAIIVMTVVIMKIFSQHKRVIRELSILIKQTIF